MHIQINLALCKGCGLCGEICTRHIREVTKIRNKKISTLNFSQALMGYFG